MPFYFGYGVDSAYLAVVLVALVLGTAAQGYIRSTYRKWSQVDAGIPGTGAEVARVRGASADGGASGVESPAWGFAHRSLRPARQQAPHLSGR